MKILVLSDSHSYSDFMKRCMDTCHPDAVIHLGDYVMDGKDLSCLYPGIPFYQVPGNCDSGRCDPRMMHTVIVTLSGARLMLTHGHHYFVKESTYRLLPCRALRSHPLPGRPSGGGRSLGTEPGQRRLLQRKRRMDGD